MRDQNDIEHPLRIKVEDRGGARILHLRGQVNELGSDALSAEIDRQLEQGCRSFVFDLADVNFMGSSGLGQIMRAYRMVRGEGFVRIAEAQPLVADLFKLTKLDKLLDLFDSVEEALGEDDNPFHE